MCPFVPKRDYMATLHDSSGQSGGEAVKGSSNSQRGHTACVVICLFYFFGLRRGDLNGSCNWRAQVTHELRMLCKNVEANRVINEEII